MRLEETEIRLRGRCLPRYGKCKLKFNIKVHFLLHRRCKIGNMLLALCPHVWCHLPLTCPARSTTDNWGHEDLTLWPAEPSHTRYCSAPPVEKVSDSIHSVALELNICWHVQVTCSDGKPCWHQCLSPAAVPTFAEWFLLEDLGLPLP